MTGDLTTLAKVKLYLGIDAVDQSADTNLKGLISSQSGLFLKEIRRNILYKRYVEIRDGEGTPGIDSYEYPIQKVESVTVDGVSIDPAVQIEGAFSSGWVVAYDRRIEIASGASRFPFPPQEVAGELGFGVIAASGSIGFGGGVFRRGHSNVVLTYWAGFLCNDGNGEAANIPASSPYTVQALDNFYSDVGVVLAADGVTALVKVGGTPTTGQYAVSATGLYTFAAADAGTALLLNYAIVPIDIEQAIHWMIEYQRAASGHVGQKSKEMGTGQMVSFTTDSYDPRAQTTIAFYERKW